jgi:hypothetical protein
MLEVRTPSMSDALAFAGGRSFLRKVLLYQVRHTQASLVLADGEPLALVMFYPQRKNLAEYAMVTRPAAAEHMTALVRLAHLTLSSMAQKGVLVMAKVRETDARAQRMARLVGFGPGRFRDRTIWLWRLRENDRDNRRIDGQGSSAGGQGSEAAGATDGRRPGAPALC